MYVACKVKPQKTFNCNYRESWFYTTNSGSPNTITTDASQFLFVKKLSNKHTSVQGWSQMVLSAGYQYLS